MIGLVQYKEALLVYAMLLCRKKYQVVHALRLVPRFVSIVLLTSLNFSYAGVIACKHQRYLPAIHVREIQGEGEKQYFSCTLLFPMICLDDDGLRFFFI